MTKNLTEVAVQAMAAPMEEQEEATNAANMLIRTIWERATPFFLLRSTARQR
jgi:hypothetical protein